MTRPALAPRPQGAPRAAALFLPGGVVQSGREPGWLYPPAVRMYPFAADLARVPGLAVHIVRYRATGWNDGATAADVTAVLDELHAACGDVPTVLVGHSLGARASLVAAGHPLVRGVCALAAWIGQGDGVDQLAGRAVLFAHGDATASRARSARWSRRDAPRPRASTRATSRCAARGTRCSCARSSGSGSRASSPSRCSASPRPRRGSCPAARESRV